METASWLDLGGDLWRHETKWVKTEAPARFWKETRCRKGETIQMSHQCDVMRGVVGGRLLRSQRLAIPSVTPD